MLLFKPPAWRLTFKAGDPARRDLTRPMTFETSEASGCSRPVPPGSPERPQAAKAPAVCYVPFRHPSRPRRLRKHDSISDTDTMLFEETQVHLKGRAVRHTGWVPLAPLRGRACARLHLPNRHDFTS